MSKSPEERRAAKNASAKKWRDKNPDKVRAMQAKSHAKHKDKIRAAKKAWDKKNRDKRREYAKRWREKNPEKYHAGNVARGKRTYAKRRDQQRAEIYLATYGITVAEFDAMLHRQGGVCAVCRKPEIRKRRMCVDHCHESQSVRGILCSNCNTMLGLAKDNIRLLRSAIKYLMINYQGGSLDAEDKSALHP